jgi:hypothetical protein
MLMVLMWVLIRISGISERGRGRRSDGSGSRGGRSAGGGTCHHGVLVDGMCGRNVDLCVCKGHRIPIPIRGNFASGPVNDGMDRRLGGG